MNSSKSCLQLIVLLFSYLLVARVVDAQVGPREFFKAAPADLFYTEDEMSERDKAAVIKGGFRITKRFNCSVWGVAKETKDSLSLQYCDDSVVNVRVFRSNALLDDAVVAVESSRSSGRASDLNFFRFKKGQQNFSPLTIEELKALGIEPLTENDFLDDSQKFAPGEDGAVRLVLNESGDLSGELMTWMDPRWEQRRQAYTVQFVWSGGQFVRRKERLKGDE